MSQIFQHILSLILVYRYVALFIISFVSSMGIPLPAAASAVAAAAFAGQGYLNILLVVVVGAAGNILGDVTMYWLVRRYGRKVLTFIGLRRLAESNLLRDVEGTIETYKAPVIVASRFQDQTTTLVNIISGLGKMDFRRFLLLVSIGDLLQIIFYVLIGFVFADNWQSISNVVGQFGWIIALVVIITVTLLSTRVIKKHLRKK